MKAAFVAVGEEIIDDAGYRCNMLREPSVLNEI